MRLIVLWIGKSRSPEAAAWTEELARRIGRFTRVEAAEIVPRKGEGGGEGKRSDRKPRGGGTQRDGAPSPAEAALLRRAGPPGARRLLALDPAGRRLDSAAFAALVAAHFARDPRDLAFALGGADGWTPAARAAADEVISLSPLTYSHELARVMLLEQLYRALAVIHHHPFPR